VAFTGAYAEHPFTKEPIPYLDWRFYVLAAMDWCGNRLFLVVNARDYEFCKNIFKPLRFPNILFKDVDISQESVMRIKKNTIITNSDFFLDG